jgi:hypothetical protein
MLCMPGFKPHSVARKKCMADASWRGEEGECRPLTCPALSGPAHGRVEPQTCITGKAPGRLEENFFDYFMDS